jgi:hypothetical protein
MGNVQYQCPTEFEQLGLFACRMKCPTQKGFEVRNVNGIASCVYKTSPENYVNMKLLTAYRTPIGSNNTDTPPVSFESFKENKVHLYNTYKDEYERFNEQIAIIDAKVGRQKQIQDAFRELQDAENARAEAPEAYQEARIRYYTLTKGETWLQEERERLAKADVNPVINNYADEYDDMKRRIKQQQRTVDVVNGVKDKLLSVQDELATSVGAFGRQLNGLKNMINMERRKQAETQTKSYEWIGLLLNIILTIAIVFAVISLIRVFINRSRGQTSMPYPSRYNR